MSGDPFQLSVTVGGSSFEGSGDPETVMGAFKQFRDMLQAAEEAPEPPSEGDGGKTDPQPPPASETPKTDEPLPVFLRNANTHGNPAIATAIVAWAEQHEGKSDGISGPEIRKYWNDTTVKLPANLPRDIKQAAKQGFLDKSGNAYRTTGFGRKTIGLPE